MKNLFYTKPVSQLHEDSTKSGLKRSLSRLNLVSIGIGGIIGAGIFVLSGQAAAEYAGPAILISFLISGFACAMAGLCYAEFASMIPLAGSAYTYAYATMGELVAWVIGWDLILEYLFAASTVAVGWASYVISFLKDIGIILPPEYTTAMGTKMIFVPQSGWQAYSEGLATTLAANNIDINTLQACIGVINVPAMFIVAVSTIILIIGIKESANFNNLMVALKLIVIVAFIGIGYFYINTDNWHPFIPENTGKTGQFGWSGILRGAGVIFFAYIGFDSVSAAAQESKNPQKDMPIGIMGSLGVSTLLYIAMALVLTGIVNYKELGVSDPVALAVDKMGTDMIWLRYIIKIAAIAGLSSVVLVMLLGQPRIFFSMAQDGLLPSFFKTIHPKFKTPYISTIITGVFAMVIAGLLPINLLGELVSIGTLLAFVIVCIGIIVLRKTKPDIERPFRTPFVPLVPILGAVACLFQMVFLPGDTWLRLIIWLAIGMLIYFFYSKNNAEKLRNLK